MSSFEEVKKTLSKTFGAEQFHFLINNAGIDIRVPFVQTTEAEFDELMNIHLKGVFPYAESLAYACRRRANHQSVQRPCTLQRPGYSAYASMKGAIEMLSRYMAAEPGKRALL